MKTYEITIRTSAEHRGACQSRGLTSGTFLQYDGEQFRDANAAAFDVEKWHDETSARAALADLTPDPGDELAPGLEMVLTEYDDDDDDDRELEVLKLS